MSRYEHERHACICCYLLNGNNIVSMQTYQNICGGCINTMHRESATNHELNSSLHDSIARAVVVLSPSSQCHLCMKTTVLCCSMPVCIDTHADMYFQSESSIPSFKLQSYDFETTQIEEVD